MRNIESGTRKKSAQVMGNSYDSTIPVDPNYKHMSMLKHANFKKLYINGAFSSHSSFSHDPNLPKKKNQSRTEKASEKKAFNHIDIFGKTVPKNKRIIYEDFNKMLNKKSNHNDVVNDTDSLCKADWSVSKNNTQNDKRMKKPKGAGSYFWFVNQETLEIVEEYSKTPKQFFLNFSFKDLLKLVDNMQSAFKKFNEFKTKFDGCLTAAQQSLDQKEKVQPEARKPNLHNTINLNTRSDYFDHNLNRALTTSSADSDKLTGHPKTPNVKQNFSHCLDLESPVKHVAAIGAFLTRKNNTSIENSKYRIFKRSDTDIGPCGIVEDWNSKAKIDNMVKHLRNMKETRELNQIRFNKSVYASRRYPSKNKSKNCDSDGMRSFYKRNLDKIIQQETSYIVPKNSQGIQVGNIFKQQKNYMKCYHQPTLINAISPYMNLNLDDGAYDNRGVSTGKKHTQMVRMSRINPADVQRKIQIGKFERAKGISCPGNIQNTNESEMNNSMLEKILNNKSNLRKTAPKDCKIVLQLKNQCCMV